jgi:hypothetical protein
MPDDILSHEMLVSGSKMSWEQALADPHLMRLGDWLARQLGEREMAKLEAEGWSKEDLEKQHLRGDYRAERLKLVMVKSPSSRFRPFVQVWVSKAESHAACPMSRGAATEVQLEKEEQTRATKNVKYNEPDYSLMDTNHSDTGRLYNAPVDTNHSDMRRLNQAYMDTSHSDMERPAISTSATTVAATKAAITTATTATSG